MKIEFNDCKPLVCIDLLIAFVTNINALQQNRHQFASHRHVLRKKKAFEVSIEVKITLMAILSLSTPNRKMVNTLKITYACSRNSAV